MAEDWGAKQSVADTPFSCYIRSIQRVVRRMDRQSGSIQTKAKGASGEKTIAAVRQVDETRGKRKTSEKEEVGRGVKAACRDVKV